MKHVAVMMIMVILLLPVAQAVSISNVVATPSDTGAIISWQTDELSDSAVGYGSEGITDSVSSSILTLEHEVGVDGLDPGTEYVYFVQSNDTKDDNTGTFYTFTTNSIEEESEVEEVEEVEDPDSIDITVDHPETVRGASVDLTGSTFDGAEVRVFINENYVSMTEATGGSFEIFNVPLAPNEVNQLLVEAKVGETTEYYLSTVTSDTAHPEFTISDIPEIIEEVPYMVTAESTEEVDWSYTINGNEREAESGMKTTISLDVEEGENVVAISATDSSGWVTTTTYNVYADTQPPEVSVTFEKGNEYFQNRAVTNIYGETEPGSTVFLYVVQPTSFEQRPDFTRPWKSVQANSVGNYTFADVDFEKTPFNFAELTPTEVPAGLEEVTVAAMSDWQNAESYNYNVFVIAEDASGKTGFARESVVVNSCYSSNFDFQITSIAQFQRPYKLNPTLLDEGREQATAVFNITQIGTGDYDITSVDFQKACTDSMMEDPVFELGCSVFPSRVQSQSSADKRAHYLEFDLSSSEKLTEQNPDLWEEFKKRQIVFPMKVSVTYRAGDETRTQSSCVDLGYFIDIPINSSDLIPDWMANNTMQFLNKTITTLDKIIPVVEKVAKYVAMACQVSIGLETVVRFTRNIVQNGERVWSVDTCKALDTNKYLTEAEYNRVIDSQDSILINRLTEGSFKESMTDQVFLDSKCPSTASLWDAETQLVNLRRLTCDRALCREVPSRWTEEFDQEVIGQKIRAKSLCSTASSCQRMTKIENCRAFVEDTPGGKEIYKVDDTKLKQYASCYYYEVQDIAGQLLPKDLYVYTSAGTGITESEVVPLEPISTAGVGVKKVHAYREGGQDSLCVPPDVTCATKCAAYQKQPVKDGYSITDVNQPPGGNGACYKVGDGVYETPTGPASDAIDSTVKTNAGMTKDCFVTIGDINPATGLGASDRYSCFCEAATEASEPVERVKHYEYRLDAMSRNMFGTGIRYSDDLYYQGRDFTAAFGQNRLSDMITGANEHPTISPYGFIGSIQTICVSTILKNLISIRSILTGARDCIEEAKYTGFHDAGMCKTLFTQHVCGLVSKFVASFANKCGGSTIDDAENNGMLSGVGKGFEVLGTSISDTISQSATELTSDYDNAYFNEYFGGGVEGVTQSICLAAFGYDFPIGFDTAMDMVYSVATESTVQAFPATKQFSNYNPLESTAVMNYEVGVAIVPGCPVTNYKTELLCVGAEDLSYGADCSKTKCNCLMTAGTTAFEQFRSVPIEGGVGANLESNQLMDLPIPSPLKIDSQFSYDHVKVTMNFDQNYDVSQCAGSTHVQGNSGVWYFPIKDLSSPDISCQVEAMTGRYMCPEISDLFSSGGNAYFTYPYIMCSDPLGAWLPCESARYGENDRLAVKVSYRVDDQPYCLEYSVNGRGVGGSKSVKQIPAGTARDETYVLDLGTVSPDMLGGSSAKLERLSSSTNPCPSSLSGPTTGTQGGKEVTFTVKDKGNGKYTLSWTGQASVVTDANFNYNADTVTYDGSTELTATQLNDASFVVDGVTVDGVAPAQDISCGYRSRAEQTTSTTSSTATVSVRMLQASDRGDCLNANTLVPQSVSGDNTANARITIGDPTTGLSGGITSSLHTYYVNGNRASPKNFVSMYAAAAPMIDQKDGSIQELLGLYYTIMALGIEGYGYAVPDRMDQLLRLGSYSSLPAWTTSIQTELQKIQYYACKKVKGMTNTQLSSDASTKCDQIIDDVENP